MTEEATNYAPDPGFEGGALYDRDNLYEAFGGVRPWFDLVAAPSISGKKSLRLRCTENGYATPNAGVLSIGWSWPAVPGEVWGAGVTTGFASSNQMGGRIRLGFLKVGGGVTSAPPSHISPLGIRDPMRLELVHQVAPADAVQVYIKLALVVGAAFSNGSIVYDDVVMTKQPALPPELSRNLIKNPSALDGTAFVVPYNSAITVVEDLGEPRFRVVSDGVGAGAGLQQGAMSPVVAGERWTTRVSARATVPNRAVRIYVDWRNAGGTFLSTSHQHFEGVPTSEYEDYVLTATAPAGAASATPHVWGALAGGATNIPNGEVFFLDDVMFAKGEGLEYFDGRYDNARWEHHVGGSGGSASVLHSEPLALLPEPFDGDDGGCEWLGLRFASASYRRPDPRDFADRLAWVPPMFYEPPVGVE